jgi:hypothetical protein
MDNPYQPPKAGIIDPAGGNPGFLSALQQASHKPAIAWSFWERGRILHGIVLSLVFAFMVVFVRPEAKVLLNEQIGAFLGHVLIANLLYSTAYVFELAALFIPFGRVNPTLRFVMLISGTFLAACFTILAVEFQLLAKDD